MFLGRYMEGLHCQIIIVVIWILTQVYVLKAIFFGVLYCQKAISCAVPWQLPILLE